MHMAQSFPLLWDQMKSIDNLWFSQTNELQLNDIKLILLPIDADYREDNICVFVDTVKYQKEK